LNLNAFKIELKTWSISLVFVDHFSIITPGPFSVDIYMMKYLRLSLMHLM